MQKGCDKPNIVRNKKTSFSGGSLRMRLIVTPPEEGVFLFKGDVCMN